MNRSKLLSAQQLSDILEISNYTVMSLVKNKRISYEFADAAGRKAAGRKAARFDVAAIAE
jgi:hypothetical protein